MPESLAGGEVLKVTRTIRRTILCLVLLMGSCLTASLHAQSGEVTVPFEYFEQHIFLTLSLDGRPGYTFLLDSGANRDILNLRTARALGLDPRTTPEAKSIGFGQAGIYIAPEQNVGAALGLLPIAQRFSVMDLNRFEQHFHHPADGLLGTPFLRRFAVRVDFEKRLLTITPARRFRYRGLGMTVALRPGEEFAVIPVAIGSTRWMHRPADVLIDTGSNMPLMIYEPYLRGLGLLDSRRTASPGMGFGLEGEYPLTRAAVDSLTVAGAEARGVEIEYLSQNQQHVERIPGAIGNGVLEGFRAVIFDMPHGRMIFEVKPPPWQSGVERTASAGQ